MRLVLKLPFIRRDRSKGQSLGGPERTAGSDLSETAKEDPFIGLIGMLVGDRKRLPNKDRILAELGQITDTKSLPDIERERIADRILEAREKSNSQKNS